MGQKYNPVGQRIGIIKTWPSKWFATKQRYTKLLHRDIKLRESIEKKLKNAGIARIEINRSVGNVTVNIHASKPGIIIGRQGESIERLKDELSKKYGERIDINIIEVRKPELEAKLLAENVVRQIERRMPYRRAAKNALQKAIEKGAKGAKIRVSGRLNGVEIARSEYFTEGKIPLHTFRSDIDYCEMPAKTTYGQIGVKVWIYRGDVFKKKKAQRTHKNLNN